MPRYIWIMKKISIATETVHVLVLDDEKFTSLIYIQKLYVNSVPYAESDGGCIWYAENFCAIVASVIPSIKYGEYFW